MRFFPHTPQASAADDATREFGRFVAELRYGDLPAAVRERAKLAVLDWAGSALAGLDSDSARQAGALIEELDARLWAERAQTELRRISGRRPASAELTESEQQAARLAMEGRSNKEIAAALHISVHTVEAQLSRVYRKLGVRSRAELSSRLSAAAENAAKVAETAFKE